MDNPQAVVLAHNRMILCFGIIVLLPKEELDIDNDVLNI